MYLNFQTSGKNITKDNLSILDNLKNKDPRIYPEKIIDINFLIKKSKINNSTVGIIENNKKIKVKWLNNKLINQRIFKYKKLIGWYPKKSSISDIIYLFKS